MLLLYLDPTDDQGKALKN